MSTHERPSHSKYLVTKYFVQGVVQGLGCSNAAPSRNCEMDGRRKLVVVARQARIFCLQEWTYGDRLLPCCASAPHGNCPSLSWP